MRIRLDGPLGSPSSRRFVPRSVGFDANGGGGGAGGGDEIGRVAITSAK